MSQFVNDGAKSSTSSAVETMNGVVKEPGRQQDSVMKENTKEGKKYTAKDLERVTRTCIVLECDVGKKQSRLNKVHNSETELNEKKDVLDKKIEKAQKEHSVIDQKGKNISSKDFREKCYLQYKIGELITERVDVKRQLADIVKETKKLERQLDECEDKHKTNIDLKDKIVKSFSKK